MTRRVWLRILVALVLVGLAIPAGAEVNGGEAEDPEGEVSLKVEADASEVEPRDRMTIPKSRSMESGSPGLDALLQLPTGYGNQPLPQSVAGASEKEWRRRFRVTRSTLDEARKALEETKLELDGAALESGGSQWSVAPPGGGAGGGSSQSTSPLSFKLRQKLKTNRIELEAAERNLRELEIEANLAGVPKAWRGVSEDVGATPPEVGQLLD
jgi:hypothetical protein